MLPVPLSYSSILCPSSLVRNRASFRSRTQIAANYWGKKLAFMPHDVFDHLPPLLKELVLSGNQLRSFNWGRLYLLAWLELLDLGSNLLTTVPRMLSNCTQTLRFNLTRNQISKLTKDFLRDVTSLQYLDLSYTNLKNIQASSFLDSAFKHLWELWLSGNHFLCTCNARWFMWWNNQTTVYIPHLFTDVTCTSPKAHLGHCVVMVDLHSCELDYLGIGLYTFSTLITFLLLNLILKTGLHSRWRSGRVAA
ncbi:toll-like receptor 7 [Leucoraja erinacea]|uniref:toll-like receptor 7 n=1 Tax=Leucoraja erinaceus TaxID=7782 RepID=UPI0024574EF5|nr:toll-like receptor 7 [Leucoraja erinacea]